MPLPSTKLKFTNNFREFVDLVAEEYSDKVAFQIRRRIKREQIYYKDLPEIVNKTVAFFETNGVKEGDKVLLWGLNCPEYSILLLSIFLSNRTAVPIDFRTSEETINKVIDQTNPKVAFVSSLLNSNGLIDKFSKSFYIEELFSHLDKISRTPKFRNRASPAPAEIIYTSGTTGIPKGVVVRPETLLENLKLVYDAAPVLPEHRTISILPLSHMFEQVGGLLLNLALGSSVSYMTRINSFRIRQALKEFKPTHLFVVPQLISIFWDKIEDTAEKEGRLDSLEILLKKSRFLPQKIRRLLFRQIYNQFGGELEWIVSGGAPLNYEVAEKMQTAGFNMAELYGATECMMVSLNLDPNGLGTTGRPMKGIDVKINSDNVIWVRTKYPSDGYYKNKTKTDEVFVKGWYNTGDTGRFDEEGRLIILGRDVFKLVLESGENVYVEDLEKKINIHPRIKDSCIVGIDSNGADKIHAVFLLKEKASRKELKEIVREINANLESFQQILSYSTWDEADFPRTHTLKINRPVVQKHIAKTISEKVEKTEAGPPVRITKELTVMDIFSIVSKIPKSKIKNESLLALDLGLDSLGRAELTALIEEELGLVVEAIQIDAKTTVGDIKKMLAEATEVAGKKRFPTWQYSKFGEIMRLILAYLITFPLHALFAKIEVENPENLKNLGGRSIIVFNHPGLFDGAVILRLLKSKYVKGVILAGGGFWDSLFWGKLLEIFAGGFPVDQTGKYLTHQLKVVSDLVDEGRFVVIAPQGRLQRKLIPDQFKAGVGYIAQELQLPVVPVKLTDYEKIWPPPREAVVRMRWREAIPKRRGIVRVKIGDKLEYKDLKDPVKIANKIEAEFNKL